MRVLKFGGTSVGKPESLTNVKKIVEAAQEPVVVVVSALGGITDKLIECARKAAAADDSYQDTLTEIRNRHHAMVQIMVAGDKREAVGVSIEVMLTALADLLKGVRLVQDLSEKTLDHIVSFGERMSSVIVAATVRGAVHVDSLSVIKTEKWFNRNIISNEVTTALVAEAFSDLKAGEPVIMGGFISRDKDTDDITNLGRGGSDYTAAIVAATLSADVLEIWTDVDGFMSADPRVIPEARVMDEMSFVESMELCSFGAKVIFPPTIYPVFHKNIPIRILNTFRPQVPGTIIADHSNDRSRVPAVRGVSTLKDVALISAEIAGAANVADLNSRVYNILAKNGIRVLLVSQSEREELNEKVSFAVAGVDAPRAMHLLATEFAPEMAAASPMRLTLTTDMAIVAMVGENILGVDAIKERMYAALAKVGVQTKALAFGASLTTITMVVSIEQAAVALKTLHKEFIS